MPGRAFTNAERSTAVALARMTSVDSAAATLEIDRRTVRAWVNAAPPEDEGDAWAAAQRLAQQQLLTSLATGKVKQPNILAVVAGIATDKLHRLARRREVEAGKHEPESPPTPLRAAIDALTPEQHTLAAWTLRLEIDRDRLAAAQAVAHGEPRPPSREDDGHDVDDDPHVLAFLAEIAARSPDEIRAELDRVAKAQAQVTDEIRAAEQPPRIADAPEDAFRERVAIDVTPTPPPDAPRATERPTVVSSDVPEQWQPLGRFEW